jgi:hypothetical protein
MKGKPADLTETNCFLGKASKGLMAVACAERDIPLPPTIMF